VVLVQSHALVANATLCRGLLALSVWCSVVNELEVRVRIRTSLVDDGTTFGRSLLL
jgi:hypothetical protein